MVPPLTRPAMPVDLSPLERGEVWVRINFRVRVNVGEKEENLEIVCQTGMKSTNILYTQWSDHILTG